MSPMRTICVGVLTLAALQAQSTTRLHDVRVQVLSTMLTDSKGIGEWGFAALVEADGRRILFDTGARPDTVWKNVQEMKVDLSDITDVILSHNHGDHTAGLLTLRRELAKKNPKALTRAHVGRGAFYERSGNNLLRSIKADYESTGAAFIEYDASKQIFPGVWLTGPVKRVHPERNWSGAGKLTRPDGTVAEDNLPEDMSLVLDTDRGLIVVSGCGHAGIINTLEQARHVVRSAPIHAAIGGWHLFAASDSTLDWTAGKLKEFGIENFLGAHCTGIEAVYQIRAKTGLTRRTASVAAVGAEFTLKNGMQPGTIAK